MATKKGHNLFPSTAQLARQKAMKKYQPEIDKIVALINAASDEGKFTIKIPQVSDAIRDILVAEHELSVKLIADWDTNPVTLYSKISW